jgi:hypothetical protein
VKIEVEGESDFYHWVTLVPFEGAENGWTCNMLLVAPAPHSSELVEQPAKEVGDASVSAAALPAPPALAFTAATAAETSKDEAVKPGWSRDDAVKVAEDYAAELLPAFKELDVAKLEGLYTPGCVFGNPDAGEPGEQKDVIMKGMKSVGLDHASKAFRDEVKAMKIMSAITGILDAKVPVRIIALVKVEVESCEDKKSCKGGAFYQWVVLVPSGSWHGETSWLYPQDNKYKQGSYKAAAVLVAPAPASRTAELLEQPVQAVGDASVPVAALPASLALLATFASGVLVSGCFFGRKEIFARITAPSALKVPLLEA